MEYHKMKEFLENMVFPFFLVNNWLSVLDIIFFNWLQKTTLIGH